MLSAIGLALDIIGAYLLAKGLFRHSVPLYPGWSRDPYTAGQDRAYGTVGLLFLVSGFALQGLSSLGLQPAADTATEVTVAALALSVGILVAFVLRELAVFVFLNREAAWAREAYRKQYPVVARFRPIITGERWRGKLNLLYITTEDGPRKLREGTFSWWLRTWQRSAPGTQEGAPEGAPAHAHTQHDGDGAGESERPAA
jgi:hypothetical protein